MKKNITKKTAFTLIELLAVIVILAIVALISVPVVLNVMEKAKESAFKNSVYGIFDAYSYKEVEGMTKIPEAIVNELDLQNAENMVGKLVRNNNKIEAIGISDGTYCAKGSKTDLVISKGECEILDLTEPVIKKMLLYQKPTSPTTLISKVEYEEDTYLNLCEFNIVKDGEEIDESKWEKGKISGKIVSTEFKNLEIGASYSVYVRLKNAGNLVKNDDKEKALVEKPFPECTFSDNQVWTKSKTFSCGEFDSTNVNLKYEIDGVDITGDINTHIFNENNKTLIVSLIEDETNDILGSINYVTNYIDSEKPSTPIVTGGNNTNSWSKSVTINVGTSNDNQSGVNKYEYYLTNSDILPNDDTIATSDLVDFNILFDTNQNGSYLYVRAIDNVGWKSEWSNVQRLYIDINNPILTVKDANSTNVTMGQSHEIMETYFTVDQNGNAPIISSTCLDTSNGDAIVTNTSSLGIGQHVINCTVSKGPQMISNVSTKTIVIKEQAYASLYEALETVNRESGYYAIRLENDVDLNIQIVRHKTDVTYAANPTLCDNVVDTTMCVAVYDGNLTINSGVTVTPQVRKKGFTVYVKGTLTNDGTISMTARGANAVGQDLILYEHQNGTKDIVPASGASGASGTYTGTVGVPGNNGNNASSRATGGGGSGASGLVLKSSSRSSVGGSGSAGTSYSGGSGGGGVAVYAASVIGNAGGSNGGPGGAGYATGSTGSSGYYNNQRAGGGAGNDGGFGMYRANKSAAHISIATSISGSNGTGGLLIVYADTINNNGSMTSQGSSGGYGYCGGGSSGGGSINVFYKTLGASGQYRIEGGERNTSATYAGGAGGNGTYTLTELN